MKATLKTCRIYFDTCCICRPYDNQIQRRIKSETAAIMQIISYFSNGEWQWIDSKVLRSEINRISNPIKLSFIKALLNSMPQSVFVSIGKAETERGTQIEALGFEEYDALHIACAESGKADIFLTTDDDVIDKAKLVRSQLRVRVKNPETWLQKTQLQEVIENECIYHDR